MNKRIKPFLAAFIVIILLALVHLYINTKSIGLHYEVKQLKIKLGKLHDETSYLNCLISEKRSLSRIEKTAEEQLNMVRPDKITYLRKK